MEEPSCPRGRDYSWTASIVSEQREGVDDGEYIGDETRDGAGGVCAARKAEDEDLVAADPVVEEPDVGFADVFVETRSDTT